MGSGYVYAGEQGQKEQGKDELAKPQKRPAHANDKQKNMENRRCMASQGVKTTAESCLVCEWQLH
jgi:alkylated DNA repair dioxygenase AlkB